MISNSINSTQTVRNVYIIDDKGIIRTILVYPMTIGRCIPEILRIIKALQTADSNDAATPANWMPGEPIIISAPYTSLELEERVKKIEKEKNGLSWYLSFKKSECDKELNNIKVRKIEDKNFSKNKVK